MNKCIFCVPFLAALALAGGFGCSSAGSNPDLDAGVTADAGAAADAGATPDAGADAGADAGPSDAGLPTYDCKGFSVPSGWTPAAGFRAVKAFENLNKPVALTFAGGAYGAWLYIVNQGDNTVYRANLATGALELFATLQGSGLLTTITWDSQGDFDGSLYVGDQGSNGDKDSTLYRLSPQGALVAFASSTSASPKPGLDDIYALAFTPGPRAGWPKGVLVTGDTDGAATTSEWGLYDSQGAGSAFSALAGTQGLCADTSGQYGGGMLASRPAGGGFSGDDTITRVQSNGTSGGAVATGLAGVHAVVVSPPGPFGQSLYAASWSSQRVFSVNPLGATQNLATGLSLTNYDGNILAFSPDGKVLLVADRSQDRVVCIEPTP